MYFVNSEQIEQRLDVIPELVAAFEGVAQQWEGTLLQGLAQERALHLAIETVTDVGSCLIDGFIMRDASSYEDIIAIIHGESVFPDELYGTLKELVKLRKPLVQDYFTWARGELHPLSTSLPDTLSRFAEAVRDYLAQELV
ncbi:DUF86 domain-containing protein [Paenibacillus sp. GCM10012307]|uniref:DUF86 domain-containing protein n=1 Tax=Paenibacillus roseus TaxID=2798579 RepID=A0A934J1M8_9BACL|nr:HepT-like ribonuclease domain-containing protein [Paenibacillus roseus]MBJ6359808.1 DUF86 domain-containing protein [Paenibacillus roseus]